jgi:hypothetical protein
MPSNNFRFRARSAFLAVLLTFRGKPRSKSFAKPVLCGAMGCLTACLFFSLAGQSGFVWGQSQENVEVTQSADAINPQYEYNVKAAFLYSFGRYVEWPKDSFAAKSGVFVVGICGEDAIGQILDRIALTKTIQGRRIVIQRMPNIEDLQPCQILFISHSMPLQQQIAIINKMRGKSTLLVGESPGFTLHGGGINFFVEGSTVRFEINAEAVRQENLLLDAKLLNLGKKVAETGINK